VSVPFRILVVCIGNVCRSPLAERLLRLRLDQLLGEGAFLVEVSSAGVRALAGRPMDDRSASELVRLGGDPTGFVAKQLSEAMVENADLVLTASTMLRSRVLAHSPRALRRTFTIVEFATLTADRQRSGDGDLVAYAASMRGTVPIHGCDVPDPIGQSRQVHRRAAALLDHSCTAIAVAVAEWLLASEESAG
jgi:protein-tyrosine phosphatase